MDADIDKRADSNWKRAQIAYGYYVSFIDEKDDRFSLNLVDLLYVMNFKGGSSIITEPADTLVKNLKSYEKQLSSFAALPFSAKSLKDLSDDEYREVKEKILAFCKMAHETAATRIKGFGVSFSSALLHFYFPALVPILDRRAAHGAGVVDSNKDLDKSGNIKDLLSLYPALIDKFRERLKGDRDLSLRNLDHEYFRRRILKHDTSATR